MAFAVTCADGALRIDLSGWDRLLTRRRMLTVDLGAVSAARIEQRVTLEAAIEHRVTGVGTHDGRRRPGRRRVGRMLGRGVSGEQFWAVSAGATDRLLVLDVSSGAFVRVVVDVGGGEVERCVMAAVVPRPRA